VPNRHKLDSIIRPVVLLAVIAVVALWDRRPVPRTVSAPAPIAQEQPASVHRSVDEMSQSIAQCAQKSGEEFRRAWNDGTLSTDAWTETAEYTSHYNAKQDACFFLITVVRQLPATGAVMLVRKMLYDANEGELYGEYAGPQAGGSPGSAMPDRCRMTAFYCASRKEWDRLAETFMEPGSGAP
jgi:hypothetical protein